VAFTLRNGCSQRGGRGRLRTQRCCDEARNSGRTELRFRGYDGESEATNGSADRAASLVSSHEKAPPVRAGLERTVR
jgi:hypothetical protein